MGKLEQRDLERFVLTLPWALVRWLGRLVRRFFVAIGVLAALAVLGYVEFESIVEAIDSRYWREIDARLGIDKNAISRLHDPAYFARESELVTDQRTITATSSHERRILSNHPAEMPLYFVSPILAPEDKNNCTREGIA